MTKRSPPFTVRHDGALMDAIRADAAVKGQTVTEWHRRAAVAALRGEAGQTATYGIGRMGKDKP